MTAAVMTVAVVGTREPTVDPAPVFDLLDRVRAEKPGEYHIVSGGATGVDTVAEDYAKSRGLKLTVFRANWKLHGRRAGPMRNASIVAKCDWVAAFPLIGAENKGTNDTMSKARKAGKPIIEVPVHKLSATGSSNYIKP